MHGTDSRVDRKLADIQAFIGEVYGGTLHAKRVNSLAGATLGVMEGASLAVGVIGHSLAQARGRVTKHAIKQVDRLLSNDGIDVWDSFARWVPQRVGERKSIRVAMDWTDYDADNQSTLALNLITNHGRATPLVWLTVWKDELTGQRNDIEYACLRRLAEVLPKDVDVTILADRGFGDRKLFAFLDSLGFGFNIRFRANILVTDEHGESRPAADWVGKGGRARKIRHARLTADADQTVGAVVCVHAKGMKDAWCLAVSDGEAPTSQIVKAYAKRWSIEPSFRDTKDLRFGMGLDTCRINDPMRRDRLLLLNAFAVVLLTLLGAAGESLGFDRMLKSNTSAKRTHSLFRQGCMWFDLIPNMPEDRLTALMARYGEILQREQSFDGLFSVV